MTRNEILINLEKRINIYNKSVEGVRYNLVYSTYMNEMPADIGERKKWLIEGEGSKHMDKLLNMFVMGRLSKNPENIKNGIIAFFKKNEVRILMENFKEYQGIYKETSICNKSKILGKLYGCQEITTIFSNGAGPAAYSKVLHFVFPEIFPIVDSYVIRNIATIPNNS